MSVWEVVALTEKGRLKGIRDAVEWIDRALKAIPLREAALTTEVVREAGRIRFEHRDPADRLIVATARLNGCTLLTGDGAIIASKLVPTIDND